MQSQNTVSRNFELIQSFDMLANRFKEEGRYSQALTLCKEALKLKKSCFGEVSRQAADSLALMAAVHLSAGAYADARHCANSSYWIYCGAIGPERSESVRTLCILAAAEAGLGNMEQAQAHFDSAKERLSSPICSSSACRLEYLDRYAGFLRQCGKISQASSLEEEISSLKAEKSPQ